MGYYLIIPEEIIGHNDWQLWTQVSRWQQWADDEHEAFEKANALHPGRYRVVDLSGGKIFELKRHITDEVIEHG